MLSILMMLFCAWGYTQELPTIIPPSPEATSLAKFTEIPVSHYTGLPNISVPLHTIDFDGLKIPVSLSYHARGIKVEEIASRVGIGWALNAGGNITRQIRGKNDFHFGENGYFYGNFYDNFTASSNSSVRQRLYSASAGLENEADMIPDQFIFNFLGYSGKFIFDQKTKEPILQGYSDLKIERVGNTGSSLYFIITTQDGFKFYFGNPEVADTRREAKNKESSTSYVLTTSLAVFPATSSEINTWHLIDIVSPNGKKIHFNYEIENPLFYRRSYDKKEIEGSPSSYFSQIYGTQYQLKEIVHDQGKVKFIKNGVEREDLKNTYALSSIEIENKHKRIKKYNFNYSYSYNSTSTNVNYALYNEVQARKRLFLDNIQKIDNQNNAVLYRGFEYTNKNLLPNRFSNAQDLWGYYNGKNNGWFLTLFSYGDATVSREVVEEKAKIGLIEKMIYPTGGYTSYEFETNKAIIPDYFKDLYYANPNPIVQTRHASLRKDTSTQVSYGVYESDFNVTASDIGPMTVRVQFNGDYGTCSSTANAPYCKYRVSIVHASEQTVSNNNFPVYLFSGPSYTMPLLPEGNYKIMVENLTGIDDPNDFENSFSVYLNWFQPEQNNTPTNLICSGGNRIKKIENYSVDNGKITRTYKYLETNSTSSGLLFSLPAYYYKKETVTINTGVTVTVLDAFGARPGSPLSYEQGNHVGYRRVTEYIDSDTAQGKGGKTVYEFTNMPDGGKFYKFPYTLAVNNEWLRGKPTLVEYYKKVINSNIYSLVKKEEFTYKYADQFSHGDLSDPYNLRFEPDETIPNWNYINNKLKYYRPLIKFTYWGWDDSVPSGPENYRIYYLTGGIQKLSRKKETSYNSEGAIEVTTNYLYDYSNHYQIEGIETINSQGEIYKTANEYTVLSNPFRVLSTKTKSYKGNTKLNEQNTVYTNFGSLYLPSKVQTSKGSNILEDRVVYHSYDDKGNPTEVSKADGTHIVYIWGYNQTQPIAKIENATLSDISTTTISDIQTKSKADNDRTIGNVGYEGALRTALNTLRTSLPNAQVTTFTYDPLIGVTSVTDPRGQTMYYEYDNFNRLEFIKDTDGNLLKEYKYKYRN